MHIERNNQIIVHTHTHTHIYIYIYTDVTTIIVDFRNFANVPKDIYFMYKHHQKQLKKKISSNSVNHKHSCKM